MSIFIAAVVQLNCSSDSEANWEQARALVTRATELGANFVATPENSNFLGPHEEKVARAETLDGETCSRFSDLAKKLDTFVLLGSFNEKSEDPHRCYNTSVLFDSRGERVATYRKIHLFDVDVSPDVRFAESATVKPGREIVVARTDLGTVGMTVCYDLRFPTLFQQIRDQGAEIITVPSAFTLTTGRAHWTPLIRARAIETQSYVVAPAQYGKHDDQGLRESFGHAMIVDPWGQVVAMVPEGPGVALAEIDLEKIHKIRESIPVADHRVL